MKRYRKKPVVIEAERFLLDGSNAEELAVFEDVTLTKDGFLLVTTLEGSMACHPGDWLIRGVEGELYPCRHDIFLKTYEEADGQGG